MLIEVRSFADSLRRTFSMHTRGQPEEQLKRPTAELLEAVGRLFHISVLVTPEIVHENGRPDLGVIGNDLLCGYVELKAPGETIRPERMKGHNRKQWEKFKDLPNVLYTNSCDWALYEHGDLIESLSFDGEPRIHGSSVISQEKADHLGRVLRRFLNWTPLVPTRPRDFALFLAPLTRLLRDDVAEAIASQQPNLIALRDEWRAYLFPDFSNDEFADAYAQTVTSALLLARLEGADITDARQAEVFLRGQNTLLSRILQILTQDDVRDDIKLGLGLLQRVLRALDVQSLREQQPDPWLYFYEDFLHAYDPDLAKSVGVYYTPAQVVHCQVRFVSDLLERRFNKSYSFASEDVTVLDPAVGTGTYLVAAIQHALGVVEQRAGAQRRARAALLARNLVGFELLIGPYSVAHLRLARELLSASEGDTERRVPLRVYLSDTLDSPNPPAAGTVVPLNDRPLVQERENARLVKADEAVWVCIGNPPYNRQMDEGADRKGGWVRFGDQTQETPILEDFLAPARRAGQGANLRSIYNDYVYFWRWALWKVFESPRIEDRHPGIVSFITGSSYLSGPGFVGMREHMRSALTNYG